MRRMNLQSAALCLALAACTGSSSEPGGETPRSAMQESVSGSGSSGSGSSGGYESVGPVSYHWETGAFLWAGVPVATLACSDWNDPRMEGTFEERVAFLDEKCLFTPAPEVPLPPDPCDASRMAFAIAPGGQSYTIDKCESVDGQDPYYGSKVVWHTVPDWSTSYDAECYVETATGNGCCNFYVEMNPDDLSACDAVYPGLKAPPPPGGDAGPLDAGPLDAGPLDAGPLDAGPLDAGPLDAGPLDAGPLDAGPLDDAGMPMPDAGVPDAAPVADGGMPMPDASGPRIDAGATAALHSPNSRQVTGFAAVELQAHRRWAAVADPPVPPGPTEPGPPPPRPNPRSAVLLSWVAGALIGIGGVVAPVNPELGRQIVRTAQGITRIVESIRRGNNRQVPRNRVPGAGGPPEPPPPGTQRRLEERGGRMLPDPIPNRPPRVLPGQGRPIPTPERLPYPPTRPPLRPPRG